MKRLVSGQTRWVLAIVIGLVLGQGSPAFAQRKRWSEDKAAAWYQQQPWLVGSNFIPANAINELEMWQGDTFDAAEIDKELGWAEGLGMNTMRVFLHDLTWQQDSQGFQKRIDTFLTIASKHHIRPLLVLFDSCWDPFPKLGLQRSPTPGVHNSGWVQSPGAKALQDRHQYGRLKAYVVGVVGAFAKDDRVLGWDVWNEPDNDNASSYGKQEPKNKTKLVLHLLPQAFKWARSADPQQPLTSGVWHGEWSAHGKEQVLPMSKLQLRESDVISFHSYDGPEQFQQRINSLAEYHRPEICTEYMARPNGSRFAGIMPVAKAAKIGVYNWGFVVGKTQTNMPWDSWAHPYTDRQPAEWFHDIFYSDGRPYHPDEVALIQQLTGRQ